MRRKIRLSSTRVVALGFIGIIIAGALLLTLPAASRSREIFGFFNALFTAASATCVTGLIVADTWTQFSLFGQAVILGLIQIGGLGFMSLALLFSMALGRKIGLRERSVLMESLSTLNIGGVVALVKRVLIGTAFFEGAGAALLAVRFCPELGFLRGVWYGVFHSVSAFCNAGFDLMGRFGEYSSLTYFQNDVYVNLVIMLLIIIGGIGFIVWEDILKNKLHFSKYMLHTKLMTVFSAALIIIPAIALFFTEKNGSMSELNFGERALAALFQSVTARTAGFNTVDLDVMSGAGSIVMYVLMIIGGGAGSTAGGIKVTTFAMIALYVTAYCRGRSEARAFSRRLDDSQLRRAFCAAAYFLTISIIGCFVILAVQPLGVREVLFETLSATGTVGLSTGITRSLLPLPRLVLILLMYSGRIGSITVVMAVAERKSANIQNPMEKIIIG